MTDDKCTVHYAITDHSQRDAHKSLREQARLNAALQHSEPSKTLQATST